MVAALTTSLPETPGGERNWDYRYTWIRDATFTLWSLHVLGFDEEAREFMEFVCELFHGRGPEAQIMFGIGGETELTEKTLDHLSGYIGSKPVRIGNAAYEQRQNDVYGALLDSIYIHSKTREGVPEHMGRIAFEQADAAASRLAPPRPGDLGGARRPQALRLLEADELGGARPRRPGWPRDQGGGELAEGWESRGERGAGRDPRARCESSAACSASTTRPTPSTPRLLLMPLVRFLRPDDERVRATVLAIADELTEHGLVLRYRVEETEDGLTGKEGTFTICSFWLVSALSEIGEPKRARKLCERVLTHATPLGLYGEEIEGLSGAHLGNFPQAFTHLALINAVSHVIADEQMGEREAPSGVFSGAAGGGGRGLSALSPPYTPALMRAIQIEEFGGPEVMRLADVPEPRARGRRGRGRGRPRRDQLRRHPRDPKRLSRQAGAAADPGRRGRRPDARRAAGRGPPGQRRLCAEGRRQRGGPGAGSGPGLGRGGRGAPAAGAHGAYPVARLRPSRGGRVGCRRRRRPGAPARSPSSSRSGWAPAG